VVHLFSGSELLPPFSVRLSGDGKLDQRPFADGGEAATQTAPQSFEDMERKIYREALARHGGNVSRAARDLKLTRASLDYRLSKLGLR
jgi:transcriptional regulator with PAS, ATPase and Fis domain